jgi:hypothetical protein
MAAGKLTDRKTTKVGMLYPTQKVHPTISCPHDQYQLKDHIRITVYGRHSLLKSRPDNDFEAAQGFDIVIDFTSLSSGAYNIDWGSTPEIAVLHVLYH